MGLSIIGIAYSSYQLGFSYATGSQATAEARQIYYSSSEEPAEAKPPEAKRAEARVPAIPAMPSKTTSRLDSLKKITPDVVGWLRLHDTPIDYPIVQAQDNLYYLNRNYKHEESKSRSIFMDYRNRAEEENRHTVIYGRNMKDGSMFGQLKRYADLEFFRTHPAFTFDTLYESYVAEVFSVYYTTTDVDYIRTQFDTDAEYEAFVQDIRERSLYPSDVSLSADSLIITLSTCDSTMDKEAGRLAVHAKLTKLAKEDGAGRSE
ncbi:class B sortase [Paenibacillus sp. NPDC056579]|uniref:class B sortase n=1 Tax=Paenibacillus sp. NPDC056579 TaxID=3345871 RepID=UPI0036D139D6